MRPKPLARPSHLPDTVICSELFGDKDVRLMDFKLLVELVFSLTKSGKYQYAFTMNGNGDPQIHAIAHEVRRRLPNMERRAGGARFKRTRRALQMLDPSPCACGRKGLHLVNETTYCSACLPKATARLQKFRRNMEPGETDREAALHERATARRSAEKHHRATGQRRRGHT